MREPDKILEPCFGIEDVPDDAGYGHPPKRTQFKAKGEGGQKRQRSLASITRKNGTALKRMIFYSVSKRQPDGRTALETITETLVAEAMAGDQISQKLLFDQLSPASLKLLIATELAHDAPDGLSTIIIRDMTRQSRPDQETEAARARLRVERTTELGVADTAGAAMLVAASASPPELDDAGAEFEKAVEGREPIEEWDDDSLDEVARALRLNPRCVPDPNGSDPRDGRYNPQTTADPAETVVREFFRNLGANREE